MFDDILSRIRSAVLRGNYYFTLHAEEEMEIDDLTPYDVETIVLSGNIVRRQKDRFEYKYVIEGRTTAQDVATIVAKIANGAVVITVFMGRI